MIVLLVIDIDIKSLIVAQTFQGLGKKVVGEP